MKIRKVGITGNIGSGKSLVCKIFNYLGINTFFSDEETKKLYYQPEIKEHIIKHFGEDVYFNDGNLNRQLLSHHLFNNPESLEYIESILYPALNDSFDRWCEEQDSDYVLFESAIIFEKSYDKYFDKIIFVSASEEIRFQRALERDRCSEEQLRSRMRLQWSEEEKIKLSDYVINNNGDEMLIPQIIKIDNLLRQG